MQGGWSSSSSDNVTWGQTADCNIASFVPQFPAGQTQLVVPTDIKPHFIGLAFGVQNYTCSESGTFSNIGAVAELIDVSCYVNESWFPTIQNELYAAWTDADFNDFSIQEIIDFVHFIDPPQNLAQHYFVENPITDSGVSPKWDFTSSGKFKGNADAFVIAKGNGTLSSPNDPKDDVTWLEVLQVKGDVADEVFRFDTVGGQPPVNCSHGQSLDVSIKYTSKYSKHWLIVGRLLVSDTLL
ncbi:hypothetical protein IEO21_05291 [Rhodonia placenta]|uniref:Uncharacterized protein n=2 Tax=Rhodonia placenta TaxID=104341 RepID=A0A8H7P285_9APHY|nr:hypothetical protein IEO21_05291 [Postia placenta]